MQQSCLIGPENVKTAMIPLALIALLAVPLHAPNLHAQEAAADAPAPEGEDPSQDNLPQVPLTRGLAGPYLAGRTAAMENDYRAASRYYQRALAHDEGDPYLQDSALVSMISAGQMNQAAELADRVMAEGEGTDLARLTHWVSLAGSGQWDDLVAELETSIEAARADDQPDDASLLEGLLRAWALLGAGRANDSLAAFEELASIRGARPIVAYNLGLSKALVGDYEAADQLLTESAASDHYLGILARAQVLSQLEQNAAAMVLLEGQPGFADEPGLVALRDRLAAGETVPFDSIASPADGMAQVFLTFAVALVSPQGPDPLSLVQARLAQFLAPDLDEARLISAQLLQGFGQFELAEREFDGLREQGAMRPIAELSRIDALAQAERLDDAEKAALALTAAHPELAQGWIALGDLFRQQQKFSQAVTAYDKALALLPETGDMRWFPLYARGIALERSGRFDRAEGDFRAALEIQPESAQVLNYLGYSLVDRNERLDEALDLIERAVELRPDDGYILDSLAWVYFRLGRYQEAVDPMERSAAVMPGDSLVNDHMGDIYWMVGRKREAQIQWKRALSLDPETEEDAARIRDKLDRGLDAVMADEADAGDGQE